MSKAETALRKSRKLTILLSENATISKDHHGQKNGTDRGQAHS